jgi:hypothetical protein
MGWKSPGRDEDVLNLQGVGGLYRQGTCDACQVWWRWAELPVLKPWGSTLAACVFCGLEAIDKVVIHSLLLVRLVVSLTVHAQSCQQGS